MDQYILKQNKNESNKKIQKKAIQFIENEAEGINKIKSIIDNEINDQKDSILKRLELRKENMKNSKSTPNLL